MAILDWSNVVTPRLVVGGTKVDDVVLLKRLFCEQEIVQDIFYSSAKKFIFYPG